jgi:hypothetical protein
MKIRLIATKINERHIRVGVAVLTLVLFVLGAGAPHSGGGG